MRKGSTLLISLFITTMLYAGENEDINQLNQLYGEKKYNEAIKESKEFLEAYPNSKKSFSVEERLAKTYYFRKDYNKAIDAFKIMSSKYAITPEQANEYNYYISKSYLLIENPESSDGYVNKIDRKSVYYERAFYDRGIIYLDRDEYEKAFSTFKNIALNGNVFKNASVFNMALTAYNDSKYQLVIDTLNNYVQLKDKNRDDSAILYLYGTSYYKLDKTDEAVKYFESLSKKYSNTPYGRKARIVLIEIYANKNNAAKVKEYSDLVKGTPEEGEALVTLGDFYVSTGEFNKAMGYYQQANIETTPRALYGYAYSLYRLDRVSEALPHFKKLEKSTYYNQAIYYKFACYYKLKQYKTIVDNREEAKKIVVTQQDNDNVNIIIANSAYELGMNQLARDYYTKLNLHTPSKDNLFRVITMSGKLNRADDVEMRMEDYKRLYPNDTEYRKKIYIAAGEALYNNKKIEPAEKLYKEYLATDNDKDILNALISLQVNEKKYSDMSGYLDKQEKSTDNTYLRGISATGVGNYSEAEGYYNEVLSSIGNDKANPMYIKVKSNQIRNYFLWEHYDKVIAQGEEYINLPKIHDKDEIVEKIALSYFRSDNPEKSREYFSKLLDKPETSEETKFQIAESYLSEKNYPKAKEIYSGVYSTSTNEKNKEIALYSLTKIASDTGNIAEFKKLSSEFLAKYPESQYKENMISNYSQVASNITNNSDMVKSYKVIYDSSKEEHIKQNALEKMAEGNITAKKYKDAEANAKLITNQTKRAYYLSQIYENTQRFDNAAKEYEKLTGVAEYKEYATVNLAKYWYTKKNYAKSRGYYDSVLGIKGSTYKDVALFQIAQIDEKAGKNDSAIKYYKRLYTEYPKSSYQDESKLKAAQLTEVNSPNEALKIYMDIAKTSKNKSYRSFSLEKLVYAGLKSKKTDVAKKYYDELKKIDSGAAKKYEQFFQGGV